MAVKCVVVERQTRRGRYTWARGQECSSRHREPECSGSLWTLRVMCHTHGSYDLQAQHSTYVQNYSVLSRHTTLGDRAFSETAARAWNALPSSVHSAPSLLQFLRDLKTALHVSVIVLFTIVFGYVTDCNCSGKSGPKDQVALHYYYTSPSHWCTTHEVSKS